ncbi:MAG TPA: hypothetical protein VL096_07530, partial [Pirellulaceae bacterium]|nr:hypothetical protein [Pirellulaceae bacterium]
GLQLFPGVAIGISDSQIALAVVVSVCRAFRWQTRLACAAVLLMSGMNIQYACWVHYFYPLVGSEDYLAPLGWIAALTGGLWWFQSGQEGAPNPFEDRSNRAHFGLEVWGAAIILIFGIGWIAIIRTNVSGMYDPWETIEFPTFVLHGIDTLSFYLAACVVIAIGFAITSKLFHSSSHGIGKLGGAFAIFSFTTLAEGLIAYAFAWLSIEPPPLFPISTSVALLSAQSLFDAGSLNFERAAASVTITVMRMIVFGASLWLLGIAMREPDSDSEAG